MIKNIMGINEIIIENDKNIVYGSNANKRDNEKSLNNRIIMIKREDVTIPNLMPMERPCITPLLRRAPKIKEKAKGESHVIRRKSSVKNAKVSIKANSFKLMNIPKLLSTYKFNSNLIAALNLRENGWITDYLA